MQKTLLLISLTILSHSLYADTLNYCHDNNVNKQWQQLMKTNGHHPEWQEMYRLRKQFCKQVDNNQLTVEEAIRQFETERQRVIKAFKQRLEQELGKQKVTS